MHLSASNLFLALIFLKYISDTFQERHDQLLKEKEQGANPEYPGEYLSENLFCVPKGARWSYLKAKAKQPTIGKVIDDAMVSIEQDNTSLKGVCPRTTIGPFQNLGPAL
jgi:type I restriction enzyme M protein